MKDDKKRLSGDDKGGGSKPKVLDWASKSNQYNPLNAQRVRIIEEALNVDLLPSLKKMPSTRNVDCKKHYKYH